MTIPQLFNSNYAVATQLVDWDVIVPEGADTCGRTLGTFRWNLREQNLNHRKMPHKETDCNFQLGETQRANHAHDPSQKSKISRCAGQISTGGDEKQCSKQLQCEVPCFLCRSGGHWQAGEGHGLWPTVPHHHKVFSQKGLRTVNKTELNLTCRVCVLDNESWRTCVARQD